MNITKKVSMVSLAAITVILSACASGNNQKLPPVTMRSPINVAESVERLELYARPNGLELSARDELAVAQFLDGYLIF